MRVLILSCNNGGGHNSVAAAMQEIYTRHGHTADIVDAMSFLPHGWSKLGSDVHSYIYKNNPKAFRRGYRFAELNRSQFSKGHYVRNLLDLGVIKLGKYILEHQYDQVICCHVFAGLMLTDAIRRFHLPVVSSIIETDYTVTPGAEKCTLDWHFVPTEKQKTELIKFGIPECKIAVTGIPVRLQFQTKFTKENARSELGINTGKKNILVVCGSMGCGPMEEILEHLSISQSDSANYTVSIICGTNHELWNHMNSLYSENENIYVFGKVDNMSIMLDAADVYITKPGGISITEAAEKNIPMVLVNAVGGCEKHNMDFLVNTGGAVTADNAKDLASAAIHICEDESLCHRMAAELKQLFKENNSELIYNLLPSESHIPSV